MKDYSVGTSTQPSPEHDNITGLSVFAVGNVLDDFTANTSTTGSIAVGGSSTGVVNFNADRDWFRIDLAAGQTYRFNLNGNTLSDPTLALRNASGTQLAFNDDFNGRNSQITYTATSTGTYFLDAGALGSGTGSYTLLAANTSPTDDFTANTSTTGSIAVGGSSTGVVNFNADRDWFRIALTAGRSYAFSIIGSSLRDPDLYLRNASGSQLSFADDSGGSLNPTIDFIAQTTGTYYLDVGSKENVGAGAYTLYARDLFTDDDFSANTSTTGSIAVGGSSTGVVNSSGDRDWFRIALAAGQTYRFNLNGNTLSDPTLALRDDSGNQLAFNDDFNGRNSQITYTATSTGTYFLDAGPYSSGTGSYILLAANTTPLPTTDDYAADITTTGSVAIGRVEAGSINFGEDRDWFSITLNAGSTYRFNLNGNTLSDPTLSLRDSSGRNILASNDNFAPGLNSQITYTAIATGTYYLDAGGTGSIIGNYSLSATDLSNNVDRITGLVDTTIRNLVNTALGDNLFSHQELSTLLRTAANSGVTSQELSDLRTIANQFSPYLSATSRTYHQYIYNAVVNGNSANQWWTSGASTRTALGNLAAGSSHTQMNRLVDKWFGGLDLPTNFAGGDTAAGANSLTFNYGQMAGSLYVNDVAFSDINQGQAGTCYFLAACSTLANNQPQLIRDMFRDNGDGTYGVRFYGSTGNELWVTVNQAVPILSNNSLALAGNASRSLTGEMWLALAEKAYAQANEVGVFGRSTQANSYSFIEGGLEESLRHITNRSTTTYSADNPRSGWTSSNNNLTTWNSYENIAIAAINAGKSLWLGSFGNSSDSSGKRNLVSGHAFAITGYNQSNGRFTISNPWGAGGSTFAGVF
ncbi:pre-peptidase C-terminal domain-containing protein, partial [Cyanobium sp. BA20m-14]|uniref:pre-peptidase C-terminal domain-containing protein n=1 Tax=Cyanobium sp. BA20m-14 TaxID=2823703 RepID=UPI0020CCE2BC